MSFRLYSLSALVVLIVTCVGIHFLDAPVLPFATILLAGEILIAFQLGGHRLGRILKMFARSFRVDHNGRVRHAH